MMIEIDLDTTNSLATCCRDGETVIIPSWLNENLMLPVVAVDEKAQILMGEAAREYSYLHPEWSTEVFKRFIGSDRQYELGGHEFRPEGLFIMVIRALKEDAEKFLGETVAGAVISVPAYFDDKRRKIIRLTGELAGFKVEWIISEPTAAAITYGLYDRTGNTRLLVFNLGGDTFDVSTLELYSSIPEVRTVTGDDYLGGENFTKVLEKEFLERNEIDEEKLDKETATAIHKAAGNCKKLFSQGDKTVMKYRIDREEKTLAIDSKEYGELCESLLERIRKSLQRNISDAHVKPSNIGEVVLVGGITRLSVIREFIVKLFHKLPDIPIHPDEVVALGVAVQGAMKVKDEEVRETILTGVYVFTLGTKMSVERREGAYKLGYFCPTIGRNMVIPVSRTGRFYTVHDKQEEIRINVYQGESHLTVNNLLLGSPKIPVPKNKAGEGVVDVTYTYDINSILEVKVKVISTGRVKKQIIKGKYNTITDEEIQVRMEELSCLKIASRGQEENRLPLLRGGQCYEESTGDGRLAIENYMREFELTLDSKDRKRTMNAERKPREEISREEEQEEKTQRARQEAVRMLSGCG